MKPGDVVIASLRTGECYARFVRRTGNRMGYVVDIGGAQVVAVAARPDPRAVQP